VCNLFLASVRADQRALGMSMRIERSTVDQVKQRFETLKRKQAETFTEEGKPLRMCRSQKTAWQIAASFSASAALFSVRAYSKDSLASGLPPGLSKPC
jgi:hypothetical protein